MSPQLEMLKGTLDLMVLQTLAAMGALHGYGIARRIEQISGDAILLNQGTIYASLVRLEQRGLINSAWGSSENNRRAKFYSITPRGSRRLAETAENWDQLSTVIARFFAPKEHRS
jgi:PadR family transcriptional regulator, regulatory protein PadR